jgi:hypothetical protein
MTTSTQQKIFSATELIQQAIRWYHLPTPTAEELNIIQSKHGCNEQTTFFYWVMYKLADYAVGIDHMYEGVFAWVKIEKRSTYHNWCVYTMLDGDDYAAYKILLDVLNTPEHVSIAGFLYFFNDQLVH